MTPLCLSEQGRLPSRRRVFRRTWSVHTIGSHPLSRPYSSKSRSCWRSSSTSEPFRRPKTLAPNRGTLLASVQLPLFPDFGPLSWDDGNPVSNSLKFDPDLSLFAPYNTAGGAASCLSRVRTSSGIPMRLGTSSLAPTRQENALWPNSMVPALKTTMARGFTLLHGWRS